MSDLSTNYFPNKRYRTFKMFPTYIQQLFKTSIIISNNLPLKILDLQTRFKNFQNVHKQTPKHVFGNFSKLSNNTTHCQHKNTASEVQNTHPNTFPNFQNIFHFSQNTIQTLRNFPESFSNDFSKLPKTFLFFCEKNKLSEMMSRQFPNNFPSFHKHVS